MALFEDRTANFWVCSVDPRLSARTEHELVFGVVAVVVDLWFETKVFVWVPNRDRRRVDALLDLWVVASSGESQVVEMARRE